MTTPVIEICGCTFGYSAAAPVLSSINLKVMAGSFTSIIGCNGAGKTTLLRLLLGEITPQAGGIKLFGARVLELKDWSRVGYLSQNTGRSPGFPATAREVVSTGIYSGPLRFSGKEGKRKIEAALAAVGMEAYAGQLIGKLSGGQLQRVLVARALAGNPELLLLDEPTAGVDIPAARDLYELLACLGRENGLTVVMVTHDIAGASAYVDQCFCLTDGAMIAH